MLSQNDNSVITIFRGVQHLSALHAMLMCDIIIMEIYRQEVSHEYTITRTANQEF